MNQEFTLESAEEHSTPIGIDHPTVVIGGEAVEPEYDVVTATKPGDWFDDLEKTRVSRVEMEVDAGAVNNMKILSAVEEGFVAYSSEYDTPGVMVEQIYLRQICESEGKDSPITIHIQLRALEEEKVALSRMAIAVREKLLDNREQIVA